jgi:hypothetical protein
MPRFESSYPEHQVYEDSVILHASATRSTVGGPFYPDENGAETTTAADSQTYQLPSDCRAIIAVLKCSDCQSLVGDKLAVVIETLVGGNWIQAIAFTEILGTDLNAIGQVDKIVASLDEADFVMATGLAAGAKRHIFGEQWRARWGITDGGGTHSFTFQVSLQPM